MNDNDDITVTRKVEGNQIIFTVENAGEEYVLVIAQFLDEGLDMLQAESEERRNNGH